MVLNRREQTLFLAVATIVGGYGAFLFVQKGWLGPLDAQHTQIRTLKSDIAAKQRLIEQADKARRRFDEWEEISFPSDERTAQSLYQELLFKLVQNCRLEEAVVEPGKTLPGKYITRIPFTVSGKISLENLTELLYRFYEPNLLHQVRSLNITRSSGSDTKMLQVKLSVEGLALPTASHHNELLREGQESGGPLLAGAERADFAMIAQKNIFDPYQPKKERPPEAPKEPAIDAARFVYFVGAPTVGDSAEAWLYDRLNNDQRTLRAGDEFELAGIKGKLTGVTGPHMALDIDGKQWTVEMGKSLRDMQPSAVSKTAAADENGSAKKPATGESIAGTGRPNAVPDESAEPENSSQSP